MCWLRANPFISPRINDDAIQDSPGPFRDWFIMNDADARRQTPGLQINDPGGVILWRCMKVGVIYPIWAFFK
jgi:hypothetical protein